MRFVQSQATGWPVSADLRRGDRTKGPNKRPLEHEQCIDPRQCLVVVPHQLSCPSGAVYCPLQGAKVLRRSLQEFGRRAQRPAGKQWWSTTRRHYLRPSARACENAHGAHRQRQNLSRYRYSNRLRVDPKRDSAKRTPCEPPHICTCAYTCPFSSICICVCMCLCLFSCECECEFRVHCYSNVDVH